MDTISSNINSITLDVVSNIQQELDLYDVRSLVFILYDVPYTALERLTLLQRITRKNFNSLEDWAKLAQNRSTWRYEFLEALTICQLYSIIRKLGFNINSVKSHYLPNNIHSAIYVNPIKKIMYKLCEHMNTDNLNKFKGILNSHIDVREYEACELILLQLMCSKFIVLESNQSCQIEQLAEIVDILPEMNIIAAELRVIQHQINQDISKKNVVDKSKSIEDIKRDDGACTNSCEQNIIQGNQLKLKTDKNIIGTYEIYNKNRLGICYIINQENFYQSPKSIELESEKLEDRKGSLQDKIQLKKTMESLNFKVVIDDNLNYDSIFEKLRNLVKLEVMEKDSMFMLCILSHGVEGCVYSSDSLPVKVRDLKIILDGENGCKLIGKPKILIIQACQAALEPTPTYVSDGPGHSQHIRKSDFLILWATVPEYLAFRDERKGSIFIQILCLKIKELASEEQLDDIFKTVNDEVIRLCTKLNYKQVAMSENTLRKKLFLQLLDSSSNQM